METSEVAYICAAASEDVKNNSEKVRTLLLAAGTAALVILVAVPKFQEMLEKSKEGAAKGNLGSLKSAISIYYGDTSGIWPPALEILVPKYLKEIPSVSGKSTWQKKYDGLGGWVYDASNGDIYPNSIEGRADFERWKRESAR